MNTAYRGSMGAHTVYSAVGLLLLGLAMLFLYLTYRVSQWPHVNATVTRSAVVSSGENNYRAEIRVRYTVGGEQRERELNSGFSSSIHSEIQGIVEDYPGGRRRAPARQRAG